MSLIIPANSLAGGGYAVDNSLRFNRSSSDYLNKTLGTPTNNKIWTFSFWVKRSGLSVTQGIFSSGSTTGYMYFPAGDGLQVEQYDGGEQYSLVTSKLFRDVSAWYHIVVAFDTTQATSSNRIKIYVNGIQETSFSYTVYPALNLNTNTNSAVSHVIGALTTSNNINAYMSEIYFIDGQQLTPTDFGEFDADSGVWKPIAYSGTYGTNGFFLEFQSSGALGTDSSGNANTFTVNNLTSIDQTTDTPTNNFCTLNRLMVTTAGGTFATISEGATKWTSTSNETSQNATGSTIGVDKGKWYWEVKWEGSYDTVFGIVKSDINMNASGSGGLQNVAGFYGINTNQSATGGSGMRFVDNGTPTGSNGSSVSSGDIIMFALDCDNSRLYVGRNGTWENSGVPASGTGYVMSFASSTTYIPAIANYGYSYANNGTFNFGNPSFTISSGNSDANGYGNFEYAVPTGYLSLCTKNISEVNS
jgi:hypothetical protein